MQKINTKNLSFYIFIIILIFFTSSCTNLKKKNIENKVENPSTNIPKINTIKKEEIAPAINSDSKEIDSQILTTVEPIKISNKIFLITGATTEYPDLKDTIILGKIDVDNKKVKLLSIPRDVCAEFSDSEINDFKQLGVKMPKQIKISQITAYLKGHDEITYLRERIENILDINIDYYIDMDTKVFRDLVDGLGGVEIVVPDGGFYYKDPDYSLVVDLKEGKQILNGNDAESFVRFRTGYKEGDLTRIKVQREFLKKLFEKLLDTKNMYVKMSLLFNNVLKNTNSNINLSTLLSYYSFGSGFSKDDLTFYDLPLSTNRSGVPYVFLDKEKTTDLILNEFK